MLDMQGMADTAGTAGISDAGIVRMAAGMFEDTLGMVDMAYTAADPSAAFVSCVHTPFPADSKVSAHSALELLSCTRSPLAQSSCVGYGVVQRVEVVGDLAVVTSVSVV